MKNHPSFRAAARVGAFVLTVAPLLTPTAHAGQVRAEYLNISSRNAADQNANPGIIGFNGYIREIQTLGTETVRLDECAFGQPFSQWFPSDTYAATIADEVRAALYPTQTTRAAIEASGKAFRYKYLLYSGAAGDVTAVELTPANIAAWFTDADRETIATQIAKLKVAIAACPLDQRLRDLLLDVYYDYAVAEMQAVKPKLAELAKLRLGITTPPVGKFIIDQEIETYVGIVASFQTAIDQFAALLGTPFPGIDPSSFDPAFPRPGTPMGQYIFRRAQASRNSTPSSFANEASILAVGTDTTLFSGYKDLKALFDIFGERQRFVATLARLRGTRQAPGDLALARQSIALATGTDTTDLQIIRSWFPELFPPNLASLTPAEITAYQLKQQQSGVLASLTGIQEGRLDLITVSPFLNGAANLFGYDPDFLLLVQDTEAGNNNSVPRESYDVLRALLTANPNSPLTNALIKLGGSATDAAATAGGARFLYTNFQQNAEAVADDIDAEDALLTARHLAITGFAPGASPGFDFATLNATAGSELGIVLATLRDSAAQAADRKAIADNFAELLADGTGGAKAGLALQSVTLAQDKENVINAAVSTYKGATGKLYDATTEAKVNSAVSQATFDTINGAASAAGTNTIAGFVASGAIAAAGAVNIVVQGITTRTIANNEKLIDHAGVDLSAATTKADIALAVNQARLDLAALKRDQHAYNIELASVNAAAGQAIAQKTALLAELVRIQAKRDTNVSAIRKKSFADPLHYHRAEAALLAADEAFAVAQRWMFFTLQALNYKWHGQFAVTVGSKRYDTSTIFKVRNAQELNELLTQMAQWNATRVNQTTDSPLLSTRISLRDHVLTRNPQRFSLTDTADPGVRADDTVATPGQALPAVPTQTYFRKLLASRYSEPGTKDLVIPFSTVFPNEAPDRVDGNFFRGATYASNGAITSLGFWREKIQYVIVNVIASDGDDTFGNPLSYNGNLSYGGTTYFHTRVPPLADRSTSGLAIDDAPGELLAVPFRFWSSPNFSLNGFRATPSQDVSIAVRYSKSATSPGEIAPSPLNNFQINAFNGRSIAASAWVLRLNRINTNGRILDPARIQDIEFIVVYKHSDRVAPPPSP